MVWTPPKTWVFNEPLTSVDMNTYVRDNMNELANLTPLYAQNGGNDTWTTLSGIPTGKWLIIMTGHLFSTFNGAPAGAEHYWNLFMQRSGGTGTLTSLAQAIYVPLDFQPLSANTPFVVQGFLTQVTGVGSIVQGISDFGPFVGDVNGWYQESAISAIRVSHFTD